MGKYEFAKFVQTTDDFKQAYIDLADFPFLFRSNMWLMEAEKTL